MNKKTTDPLYIAAACALAALFLALAFYKLDRPAAGIDEAWIAYDTLNFIAGKDTLFTPCVFCPSVPIPKMPCFYTGVLANLIALPFLYLMGPTIIAMRLGFIVLAAAGLLSLNRCLRRWLGRWHALLVIFLTITNTVYIRAIRRGSEHEELIVLNLFCIGLALLTADKNRNWTVILALTGFLWGLGAWGKLHMCVYIEAAAAAWLLFFRAHGPILRCAREKLVFCGTFLAGFFPFINYHLQENAGTSFFINFLRPNAPEQADSFKNSFCVRLRHLWFLFQERPFEEWIDTPHIAVPLFAITTLILLCFVVIAPLRKPAAGEIKKFAASLALLYALVFWALMFTPQSVSHAHISALLMLVPLAAGIVANAAAASGRILRWTLCILLALTFAPTLAQRHAIMKSYYRGLEKAGSYNRWILKTVGDMYGKAGDAPLITDPFAQAHIMSAQFAKDGPPDWSFRKIEAFPDSFYLIINPNNLCLITPEDERVCRVSDKTGYKPISFFMIRSGRHYPGALNEHRLLEPAAGRGQGSD